MPSRVAGVERSKILLKETVKAQALKVELQNCLIKSRECFVRTNICNQSKSLDDRSLKSCFNIFYL
jgi:hypothetical protein